MHRFSSLDASFFRISVGGGGGGGGIGNIEFIDAADGLEYGSTGGAFSKILYDRPQDDLNSYRRRIDANTEQQREHADIMAALQRKVTDLRKILYSSQNHFAYLSARDKNSNSL